MSPNIIIKDGHRLTVNGEPERKVEIDSWGKLSESWINVLGVRHDDILPVIDTLTYGRLFIERVSCEANDEPPPEEVQKAAALLPSLQDLLRDHGVVIERGEYAVRILPWSDDEGWTQFAVDLAHCPKEGESLHLAQLGGSWEIGIAISLLREALRIIGEQ